MFPQRPAHVPQDLWELEFPSILGLSHPRFSDDVEAEDGDTALREDGICPAGEVATSSSSSSSHPIILEPQPALVPSPVSWSDLWNLPDEHVVRTLSVFCYGWSPGASVPGRAAQLLKWLSFAVRCLIRMWPSAASDARQMVRQVADSILYLLEHSLPAAPVVFRTIHHYFSSCTLLMNVMHYWHKDRHNEAHTMNQLIHATYPWTDGDRIILIAHHAKGLAALKPEDCSLLRQAGFSLMTDDGD